ncbi:hypothetical protein, partial [Escherichia coli]|uniref:hypothetical protein n=1 Tax=Escherichia coli TaxID=562 RepID=UPI0015D58DE8
NTSEYNYLKKRFPSLKILSIAKSGDLIPSLINIQYDKTKKESYEIINFLTRKHSTQRGGYFLDDEDFGDDILIPREFSARVLELIKEERNKLLDEFDLPNDLLDIMTHSHIAKDDYISYSYDKNKLSQRAKELLNEIKGNFIEINYSLQSSDIPLIFVNKAVSIVDWKSWLDALDEKKRKSLIVLLEKHRDSLQ